MALLIERRTTAVDRDFMERTHKFPPIGKILLEKELEEHECALSLDDIS